MDTASHLLAILVLVATWQATATSPAGQVLCPENCICYTEYLSSLESWKWIEPRHTSPLLDETSKPYLQHNEVFDGFQDPKSQGAEAPLRTAACVIRDNGTFQLETVMEELQSNIQILSILQGLGSGKIGLRPGHMSKFKSLIGLELQGAGKSGQKLSDSFDLQADALSEVQSLVYLSLIRVTIQHNNVTEEPEVDVFIKMRSSKQTMEADSNEIIPQFLYVMPKTTKETVIPYEEYKNRSSDCNNMLSLDSCAPKDAKDTQTLKPNKVVAYTNLRNLVHLRITECDLSDISWDMFWKLSKLKYLLLDKNNLLFLPDFVFYATPNLTALSLSNNRILNLQTVGLAGLLYLEKLDVTHNNITHLSELSLPPFPHLKAADFRFNPIETIFPNTFEIMNSTESLYLGSPLVELEFGVNSFYGLINLKNLDITNARIIVLERQMLRGMPNLESLTMNGLIPRISFDAFSEVPKLERLILNKCGLKKISQDAFYGLTALREMDLSKNDLTFLPFGIFDDQVNLRELRLDGNSISTISPGTFKNIPVKMVRLDNNPWHCSCDLSSMSPIITNKMKTIVMTRNSTSCLPKYDKSSMCGQSTIVFRVKYVYEKRLTPICSTPLKYRGKSVFQVLEKDLKKCAHQNFLLNKRKDKETRAKPARGNKRHYGTTLPTEAILTKRKYEEEMKQTPELSSSALTQEKDMKPGTSYSKKDDNPSNFVVASFSSTKQSAYKKKSGAGITKKALKFGKTHKYHEVPY